MDNKKEYEFIKCFNCGKHINKEDAYKKKYCSFPCASNFIKCKNCGSFYIRKKGYDEFFCSKKCTEPTNTK